ncbi:aminopeptidase, partial [Sphaerisporangium album]
RLRGPSGTYYTVKSSGGTSCTSFGTRNYSVPVSQTAAGTWTLEVADQYSLDTGFLDSWSITL